MGRFCCVGNFYGEQAMGETDLRDALAVERTHLANERTLLSYIRTALALLAGGAMVLVIGGYRFFSVRRRISRG